MNFIQRIKLKIQYIGVKKENRLDYYLQKLISNKMGIDVDKILVLRASKSYKLDNKEFDEFEFIYNNKKYLLKQDKLIKISK